MITPKAPTAAIIFDGDANACAEWVPYARTQMSAMRGATPGTKSRVMSPVEGVEIRLCAVTNAIFIKAGGKIAVAYTSISNSDNIFAYPSKSYTTREFKKFHLGSHYWYRRKPIGLCISWEYDGSIFVGGKTSGISVPSNYKLVSAAIDKNSKKIVAVISNGVNTFLRLFRRTTSTNTAFAVELILDVDVSKLDNFAISPVGFLTDARTLIVKGINNTGSIQRLYKYVFSKDFSTYTTTLIWTGGKIVENMTKVSVEIPFPEFFLTHMWGLEFANPQNSAVSSTTDTFTSTTDTNTQYLKNVIISEDEVLVTLYQVNLAPFAYSRLYTKNNTTPVPYERTSDITDTITTAISKELKLKILKIEGNSLVGLSELDMQHNTNRSFVETSHYYSPYPYYDNTPGRVFTGTINHTQSISQTFLVSVAIFTKINLIIYEKHINQESFSSSGGGDRNIYGALEPPIPIIYDSNYSTSLVVSMNGVEHVIDSILASNNDPLSVFVPTIPLIDSYTEIYDGGVYSPYVRSTKTTTGRNYDSGSPIESISKYGFDGSILVLCYTLQNFKNDAITKVGSAKHGTIVIDTNKTVSLDYQSFNYRFDKDIAFPNKLLPVSVTQY